MKLFLFVIYYLVVTALVGLGLFVRKDLEYEQKCAYRCKHLKEATTTYCCVLMALFFMLGLGFGYIMF